MMKCDRSLFLWGVLCLAVSAACGGTDPATPTVAPPPTTVATPPPAPAPTPVTPAINNIDFVSSTPASGSTLHTGIPNPTVGTTTGLSLTFAVHTDVDRAARLRVHVTGPRNGLCLTNGAQVGPIPPTIQLRAGYPINVTIRELLVTSVCFYPNDVDRVTAQLLSASSSETYYEETFEVGFRIVQ